MLDFKKVLHMSLSIKSSDLKGNINYIFNKNVSCVQRRHREQLAFPMCATRETSHSEMPLEIHVVPFISLSRALNSKLLPSCWHETMSILSLYNDVNWLRHQQKCAVKCIWKCVSSAFPKKTIFWFLVSRNISHCHPAGTNGTLYGVIQDTQIFQ